jgi:hypothetical protein
MDAEDREPGLIRPATGDARNRDRGFQAIGVAAARLTAPLVKRRGGGTLVRLKAEWTAVVGVEWAATAWPTALGRGGVLKVVAVAAAALELQHRAPLLLDRINRFFGREVATRLAIVQGPVPAPASAESQSAPSSAPAEAATLGRSVCGIEDPALRRALLRLGRTINAATR